MHWMVLQRVVCAWCDLWNTRQKEIVADDDDVVVVDAAAAFVRSAPRCCYLGCFAWDFERIANTKLPVPDRQRNG